MKRYLVFTDYITNKTVCFNIREIEVGYEDEEKYILKDDYGYYNKHIFGLCENEKTTSYFCKSYEEAVATKELVIKEFIRFKEEELKILLNKVSEKQKDIEFTKTFLNIIKH